MICFFAEIGTVYTRAKETATLLGLIKRQSTFTPVEELKLRSDFT